MRRFLLVFTVLLFAGLTASAAATTPKGEHVNPLHEVDEFVERWDDAAYHEARLRRLDHLRSQVSRTLMEKYLRKRPELFVGDADKCDTCLNVSKVIWFTLQDGGQPLEEILLLANITCHLTAKTPVDGDLCADLVDGLLEAIHRGLASIASLHFNYSMMACADAFKVCRVDCCVTQSAPEQVHLSFTGGDAVNASTMQVAWVTQTAAGTPTVVWWEANGSPNTSAAGTSRTYAVGGWIGWIHGAVMSGLSAGTRYSYRVGSEAGGWSAVFNFSTLPPTIGTEDRPLRVVSYADMGVGGQHKATIEVLKGLVDREEIDMILHTGDISYSDADAYRWDRFMREMEPIAARVPYMTCPGNHELFWNFTEYKNRFYMPAAGHGAPTDAMYYSFSVGAFRFLLMDSETWWNTPRMDPVQVHWARTVLAEANAMQQFIFVGFHRPLYCSTPGGQSCTRYGAWLRDRIEPALHDHGVAIVHTGHVHNYERSFPVFNATVQSSSYHNITSGFVHLVNGAGGCTEGLSYFDGSPQPSWSARRINATGFLKLEFVAGPDSRFDVQSSFVGSVDGAVLDAIHLTKSL